MIFIASPYSVDRGTPEEQKEIREARYHAVLEYSGELAMDERNCYSPIVYWHEIAKMFSLPKEVEYWKRFNRRHILTSHEVHVLTLPGWRSSEGVTWERKVASENNIPVRTKDPSLATIQRHNKLLTNAQ